jgi:hypothetical protein
VLDENVGRFVGRIFSPDIARSPDFSLSYWDYMGIFWKDGAGEGNRTLVISLEGCCSTIELHPQIQQLSYTPKNDLAGIWQEA